MKIRIVSPAGSIKSRVVEAGMATLRSWGHEVTLAAHALDSYGRFAGTPEERASDIVEALRDPDVDLLWATRGGYGCMQILDMIPLDLVREAKKPIVGYSDITALHALWHKAGVKSLHAPMMKHLGEEPTHRSTRTLREVVAYYEKHGQFPPRHNGLFVRDWNAEHPEAQILADEVAFVGGNDDGMTERFREIRPNIMIRNKMGSSRDFDRVAERFADIFVKSNTQLLVPMHCETWANERPEFLQEVMDDMNRIMEERGLVGRVKLLERTKWYSLNLSISELD